MASWSVKSKEALRGSCINLAGIDKVRHLAAANTNEHGATSMKPAGSSKLREGYYPIFLHTLSAGLVPPFSDFLDAVLETYQIQLLHLHPSSILILSIFAYLYEDLCRCPSFCGALPQLLRTPVLRAERAYRMRFLSHRRCQEQELHPHRVER